MNILEEYQSKQEPFSDDELRQLVQLAAGRAVVMNVLLRDGRLELDQPFGAVVGIRNIAAEPPIPKAPPSLKEELVGLMYQLCDRLDECEAQIETLRLNSK